MPLDNYTEKELLQLASEGSQPAFEVIFNRYKDKLYTFIFRLNASPEVSEDIIQETFFKLWKNRAALRDIEHFSSYLYLLSKNEAINCLKRHARETLVMSNLNSLPATPGNNNPGSMVDYKELQQHLEKSLQQLPTRQKLIYTLSRDHGLKHHEIAQKLNISQATVKNHIVHALRALREKLRFHADSTIGMYLVISLLS